MGITSDKDLIAEASHRLAVAAPDAKVILFGSHARGGARSDSDLDLLVIEPEIESRRAEFVRLREALGNLGVPVDLVVVPASHVDEWGHFEGTMLTTRCERAVSSSRRDSYDRSLLAGASRCETGAAFMHRPA